MSIRDQVRALWLANVVFTLALYVPIIDLYICDIIGLAILVHMCKRISEDSPDEFASVGHLSVFAIAGLLAICLLQSTAGESEDAGLIMVPLVLAIWGLTLVIYWLYMGGAAELAERLEQAELAMFMRRSRFPFIFASFLLGMALNDLTAPLIGEGKDTWSGELLRMALILPPYWLLNAYFLMIPLNHLRKVVEAAEE